MLQNTVREVFVAHYARDLEKEQGIVPLEQDFERTWITDLLLLDQGVIRQV